MKILNSEPVNELSKWINSLADQVDQSRSQPDDMLADMALLKKAIIERKAEAREAAIRQEQIDQERDELIIRIAEVLGISPDDFPMFLKPI